MRTMHSQPTIVTAWLVETPTKLLYNGTDFTEALRMYRSEPDAVITRSDVDASPV